MNWFDFHDAIFVSFFTVMLIIIVFLAFFIISFYFSYRRDQQYGERLKAETSTLRIYIINPKNNSVIFFDRSDLRNKKQFDMNTFYSHFHDNDVDKIKQWIIDICTNHTNAEKYIEADAILNYGKSTSFSLLKLIKYDPKEGIIHLESLLLKYITPNNSPNKKNKNAVQIGVVSRSTMQSMIAKEKSLKGFTYAIRFYYIRQKVLSNEKIERYMTVTLKNAIYPFASSLRDSRQIIDESDHELFLFDLRIASRDEAMRFASSICHAIHKCIGVNGYGESINFSIGIVENAQYYQDFDSVVSKAQEACIYAQQNSKDIFLYQKQAAPLLEMNHYRDEIENLMRPNALRYLFRPIFDVSKGKTIGYFEYIKAYDSPFSSFQEMSKYAAKVEMGKQFLAQVARYVITKFANEKPDPSLKLFMATSLQDINHLSEIISQIPQAQTIQLVLVFDEQEINENSSDFKLINDSLKKLRSKDFGLAMLMKDKNLLLDPSLYNYFDYFVAGSRMVGEIKKDNRVRLSIHSLIESLLKYHRPIIATDLEGWQAIELVIKSGVSIVSSETIASSSDMLLPIEKKKIEKLMTMDDNYQGGIKKYGQRKSNQK